MAQNNYKRKIVGAIMLCINALLLFHSIHQFYHQNRSGVLIFISIPNWVLLIWGVLAIIGIVISIRLLKNKISILKAVLLQLLIIVLLIIEHLSAVHFGYVASNWCGIFCIVIQIELAQPIFFTII